MLTNFPTEKILVFVHFIFSLDNKKNGRTVWHDASRLEMQHTTVGIVKEGDEENKLTNRNADGRQPFVCRCSALCRWSRKGSRKRFQRHRQSSTTAVCYCPSFSFLPSFFSFNFFNYLKFILSLRDVGFKETPTRVCGFV